MSIHTEIEYFKARNKPAGNCKFTKLRAIEKAVE